MRLVIPLIISLVFHALLFLIPVSPTIKIYDTDVIQPIKVHINPSRNSNINEGSGDNFSEMSEFIKEVAPEIYDSEKEDLKKLKACRLFTRKINKSTILIKYYYE